MECGFRLVAECLVVNVIFRPRSEYSELAEDECMYSISVLCYMLAIVCLNVCLCAAYLECNGFEYI